MTQNDNFFRYLSFFSAIFFLLALVFYVYFGQVNEDEGMYLTAAKNVVNGLVVYRDFAYTQTPLYPYLLAIPMFIFGDDIYTGRYFGALLAVFAALVWLRSCKRHGWDVLAIFGVMAGVNWFLAYSLTYVKSNALSMLLIALGLYFYESYLTKSTKDNAATETVIPQFSLALASILCFVLLALNRLPLLPLAFLGVAGNFYILYLRRCYKGIALGSVFVLIAALLCFLFLVYVGKDRFLYNNFLYHFEQSSLSSYQIFHNVVSAPGVLNSYFPAYLIFGIILSGLSAGVLFGNRLHIVAVSTIGGLAIVILGSLREPNVDYYLPAFPLFAYSGAIATSALLNKLRFAIPKFHIAILAVTLITFSLYGISNERWGGVNFGSGFTTQVEQARELAKFLSENKKSDGQVLTTYAYGTVSSSINVPRELSLAIFACYHYDISTARHLNIVNEQMIFNMVDRATTEFVVVASEKDGLMHHFKCGDQIIGKERLSVGYIKLKTFNNWGRYGESIDVYQRNPMQEPPQKTMDEILSDIRSGEKVKLHAAINKYVRMVSCATSKLEESPLINVLSNAQFLSNNFELGKYGSIRDLYIRKINSEYLISILFEPKSTIPPNSKFLLHAIPTGLSDQALIAPERKQFNYEDHTFGLELFDDLCEGKNIVVLTSHFSTNMSNPKLTAGLWSPQLGTLVTEDIGAMQNFGVSATKPQHGVR